MLGDKGKGTKSEDEDLNEKKAQLDIKLKKLQLELHEILDKNEGITSENKNKDRILSIKEQELRDLCSRNESEIEQLVVERNCLVDDLNHKLEAVCGHVVRAEMEKQRYETLRRENDEIATAINLLREELSALSEQHVLDMHKLNVAMKHQRVRMEQLFRDELLAMDMTFQNQAFLDLDDDRKHAMFANTKLKDELGLLSVGLSALGVRFEKDVRCVKSTKHNLIDLEKKGQSLKVAVTSLMKLKVGRKEIIKQIQKDIAQFKSQKKEIDKVLRTDPSIAELEKTLYQTNILLGKENRSIQMWKERKRLLVLLQKEFKSITAKGANFLFDSMSQMSMSKGSSCGHLNTFENLPNARHRNKFTPRTDDIKSSSIHGGGPDGSLANESIVSITTLDTSKRGRDKKLMGSGKMVSGINLSALSMVDKDLTKGLKRLLGRESVLLDAYNATPESNLTAWVTAQVLDLWNTTHEQWRIATEIVEAAIKAEDEAAELEAQQLKEAEEQATNGVLKIGSGSFYSDSVVRALSSDRMTGEAANIISESVSENEEDDDDSEGSEEELAVIEDSIHEMMNETRASSIDQPIRLTPTITGDPNYKSEPTPLLLDVPIVESDVSKGSDDNRVVPSSPLVRFMVGPVGSPFSDAPTLPAGFDQFMNKAASAPAFYSPVGTSAEDEYDHNGLSKSYSVSEVILKAQAENLTDYERRSSYVGFQHNGQLDKLICDYQEKDNPIHAKLLQREKIDFLPVKVPKQVKYLDGIEPLISTRPHVKTTDVDISKLVDPRSLRNSRLNNSKSEGRASLGRTINFEDKSNGVDNQSSQQRPAGQTLQAVNSQRMTYQNQISSNRLASTDTFGKRDVVNMIRNLKHTNEDPLSSKTIRFLPKKKYC